MLDFNNTTSSTASASFEDFLTEKGFNIPETIPDGKLHRFDIDKKNDSAGWYVLYCEDGFSGGTAGNWKTGEKFNWTSHQKDKLNFIEQTKIQSMIDRAEHKRKSEQIKNWENTRKKANKIWKESEPVNDHPYLKKKGVSSHYLRKDKHGNLVVPVLDIKDKIHSLQLISDKKKFLKFGKIEGHFFSLGSDSSKIFIVEGYSTGASVYSAMGGMVICCFNTSNMMKVCKNIRKKYPYSDIVICADNDQWTTKKIDGKSIPFNPGAICANDAAKKIRAKVVIPEFKDVSERPTDFNDLHSLEGLDVVKNQLFISVVKKPLSPLSDEDTKISGRLVRKPDPMEFILHYKNQGILPKGVVGVLNATGGTSKTFWLLNLAYVVSRGGVWGPINSREARKTLVVCGEDDQSEVDRRLWSIGKGNFPSMLHVTSVYGEVGPLMQMDGNLPVRALGFVWLEETIQKHPGLELLILDPKSRFYGLDENNSDHSTQWIQSLEYLSKKYHINIMFSHHTSKQAGNEIGQNMGRGSSAIVDGCRWQGGMVRMGQKLADKYQIRDPRNYIIFDMPKSNYTADIPEQMIFKRDNNGVLLFVNPENDIKQAMLDEFICILNTYSHQNLSRRDMNKEKTGEHISTEMKEVFSGFRRRRDMDAVINFGLEKGVLMEEKTLTDDAKKPKISIKPVKKGQK